MQIQMTKTYIENYLRRVRTWSDSDHREAGLGTIEMAILVSAVIALALSLAALLWNAYSNRSAGIS